MNAGKLLPLLAAAMFALSACAQESSTDAGSEQATTESNEVASGDASSDAELTLEQKFSYVMGMNIAQQMEAQDVELDVDLFVEALKAVAAGDTLKYDDAQAREIFMEFQTQMQQQQMAAMEQQATANKAEGEAFLAANAEKEGVVALESGLQYKILEEGTGPKPTAEDRVTVHYRGTLLDGTEFDSSYSRNQPATFPLNGVIPGWTEGVQLMAEGSKFEFYIPSDLAYGPNGSPPRIGPNATLIFEVELLKAKAE